MAYTGRFATEAECLMKAGAGASAAAQTEAFLNAFNDQAESFINILCRDDFSDKYTTMDVNTKYLLTEAASNLVGIYIAQYDASGYGSQREQENIININWARFVQCIGLLKDQKAVTELNK